MNKELKYVPSIIALSTALIISIIVLINGVDITTSLVLILATLIGFYIVGIILRFLLLKFKTIEETDVESGDTDKTTEALEEELEDVTRGNDNKD